MKTEKKRENPKISLFLGFYNKYNYIKFKDLILMI